MMETKKAYTLQQLCEHFNWKSKETARRSLEILERAGVIEADRIRYPHTFKWNGKPPTVWPPFEFHDPPQLELAIRDNCEHIFTHTMEWELPNIEGAAQLIYAAIFCLGLEEPDAIQSYEAWLETARQKLRQYYLAYRVIATIQTLTAQERKLERWGIRSKKEEPWIDLAMIYHARLNDILGEIK